MLLRGPIELERIPGIPPWIPLLSPANMFVKLFDVAPASYGDEDC